MTTETMEAPAREAWSGQAEDVADGWHYDQPFDWYLPLPLVSSSVLGMWRTRTPRYVRWAMGGGKVDEESVAKSLGSLAHCAVLEPDKLDELYVAEPEPDPEVFTLASGDPSSNPRATKAFKEAVAELEATGRTVVTHDAMQNALAMRDAVNHHKRARQLLHAEGPVEASGIVTDTETGVRLKIRPDKLLSGIGINVNLKTSQNAEREAWQGDLYRYRYFMDFAFYDRALSELFGVTRESFRHLALVIDTTGPEEDRVAVYEIDPGAMDAGAQLVEKYLYEIATCYERGEWPGHPDDIHSISLPAWAWGKVDEEIASEGRIV